MDSATERPTAWAFVARAIALPIVMLGIHHGLGHTGDIEFFHRWYLAVRESPAFYRDGPGINYPIVGVLIVSGPACVVDLIVGRRLELAEYWWVLKATLVVGEILLVLAAERLARLLGHARPRSLALILYLLPSTWAGSAWFGQIDVWGTVLLLASAAALLRFRGSGAPSSLASGLGALVLALLTKQLTWFALPALVVLLVLGLRRHPSRLHFTFALASPLTLCLVDPFLTLPDGEHLHLLHVLTHGSSHGDLVVASGASLWSLIAVGGTSASSLAWLGIPSGVWGWLAFAAADVAILRALWRHPTDHMFVAAAGLSQLAMALLLTGVHERYLAHAIPLLVIAGGLSRRSTEALGLLVGIVSGLFVLSTITPGLPTFLGRPEPTALLSLGWALAWMRGSSRKPAAGS